MKICVAMKSFSFAAACLVSLGVSPAPASAQNILNRVEQLLRDQIANDQIDSAVQQTAPSSGQPAEPGYLGMIGDDSNTSGRGINVVEVYPNQAAAVGGMKPGDLITRVDAREVRSMDDLAAVLTGKGPGTKLAFTVQRDGSPREVRVTLGKRPEVAAAVNELPAPDPAPTSTPPTTSTAQNTPPPPTPAPPPFNQPAPSIQPPLSVQPPPTAPARPRLGVRTVPVTADVQRQHQLPDASGAHVISVAVDSPAAKAGIPLGAVITEVDDTPVRTPEDLAAFIRATDQRKLAISFVQLGRGQTVTVDLGTLVLDPVTSSAPAPTPQSETRARPPQPSPPTASDSTSTSEPTLPAPGASADDLTITPKHVTQFPTAESAADQTRIEALERRVAELEARIKALEAKLAEQPEAGQPEAEQDK